MNKKQAAIVIVLFVLVILNFTMLALIIRSVADFVEYKKNNTSNNNTYIEKSESSTPTTDYLKIISEMKAEIAALNVKIDNISCELEVAENKNKEYEEYISSSICLEQFKFPLDLEYRNNITSTQGLRDPIELPNAGGTTSGKYHNALDINVPDFTPVYAAKSGKVTNVYPSYYNGGAKYKGHPTYGGLIEITHNDGTKTLYAHLSMTVVHEGDEVEVGEKIGHSGGVAGRRGSGQSTGPHLHFEIIIDINECL